MRKISLLSFFFSLPLFFFSQQNPPFNLKLSLHQLKEADDNPFLLLFFFFHGWKFLMFLFKLLILYLCLLNKSLEIVFCCFKEINIY